MINNEIIPEMAKLAIGLGIIIFAVRLCGKLVKKAGLPPMIGELLAGLLIGPFALGGITLPGFPGGIFSVLNSGIPADNYAFYIFTAIGAVIFFLMLGLDTNIVLFLRYSIAGSLVSIGGVIVSFFLGDLTGSLILRTSLISPEGLFIGTILAVTTSGITTRVLLNRKKMDSPEGVTIMAASVFDNIMGIICLQVVLILYFIIAGREPDAQKINTAGLIIKIIVIWIGFTALGMIFSGRIAHFLKGFHHLYDFPILALGIAMLLAGIFSLEGSAMITGAYITGLFLSKTEIAAEIRSRIHGLYHFFVPFLFALMGMTVDIKTIFTVPVIVPAIVLTVAAVLAKIIGCAFPAVLLGFNTRGSLRIGTGMIPRGETVLVMAGMGTVLGILQQNIYTAVILMSFFTTIIAIPLVNAAFKTRGNGTRRLVKGDDSISASWNFISAEITDLVTGIFLDNLRRNRFYVQTLNIDDGLSQARKEDIALSITQNEKSLSITTSKIDMPFAKKNVNEVIMNLCNSVKKLGELSGADGETDPANWTNRDLLSLITPDCICVSLKGNSKKEIITELADLLDARGRLYNRDQVLNDLFEREKIMSTGMQHGIALPHAKTDGVSRLAVAVGIKKEGVNFDSVDGLKTKIFIMVVSSRKTSGPHIQFLSIISSVLKDEKMREKLINAATPEEAAAILRGQVPA
ncbi:MAG: cation:proton antiporter [Treponema sp.]|nr:cation:proton antiporter [Treponema sp.]